jgi:iron(III) transport system permease protein
MAVLSAVIVVLGVGIIVSDAWLLREQRPFTTVGAEGAMDRRTRWR